LPRATLLRKLFETQISSSLHDSKNISQMQRLLRNILKLVSNILALTTFSVDFLHFPLNLKKYWYQNLNKITITYN
jgi:hypothetical protein